MARAPRQIKLEIVASLGHVAIGMCAGRAFAAKAKGGVASTMFVFAGLALLPDADYFGVALGVPDKGPLGHRGAAHSLAVPLLAAAVALFVARWMRLPARRLAVTVGVVVASHALLDAMTGGGSRGMPLLWPFSFHRFEMPWRPIPNAPCGLAYLSERGLEVAATELIQFSPFLLFALRPPLPRGNPMLTSIRSRLKPSRAAAITGK